MRCPNCGVENVDESVQLCKNCGSSLHASPKQRIPSWSREYDFPEAAYPPMRWYKFVIYVQLFLNMAAQIYDAYMFLTGNVYGGLKTEVYEVFPKIKGLDIGRGVTSIFLAIAVVVIRQRLAKFKTNSEKWLLAFYGINWAISFLYTLIASILIDIAIVFDFSSLLTIVAFAINIGLSYVYFKKRAYLFCN